MLRCREGAHAEHRSVGGQGPFQVGFDSFYGMAKLVTVVVSWTAVFTLVRVLPQAMRLPGNAKLNEQLLAEIEECKSAESRLNRRSEFSVLSR